MSVSRFIAARLDAVAAVPGAEGGAVALAFRPERARLGMERLDDVVALGPGLDLPAVAGIGKVLRLLRAARLAPPSDPWSLVGAPDEAARLLRRALGARVVLELRPRTRLRFTAWTEAGVETVDEVRDVLEVDDGWLVLRRGGRPPVRVQRAGVSRRTTEVERWWEVVAIDRARG